MYVSELTTIDIVVAKSKLASRPMPGHMVLTCRSKICPMVLLGTGKLVLSGAKLDFFLRVVSPVFMFGDGVLESCTDIAVEAGVFVTLDCFSS